MSFPPENRVVSCSSVVFGNVGVFCGTYRASCRRAHNMPSKKTPKFNEKDEPLTELFFGKSGDFPGETRMWTRY